MSSLRVRTAPLISAPRVVGCRAVYRVVAVHFKLSVAVGVRSGVIHVVAVSSVVSPGISLGVVVTLVRVVSYVVASGPVALAIVTVRCV